MKDAFSELHRSLPFALTKKEKARRLREQYERNSTPPTDFAPFARRQVRMNLWHRAVVKVVLRRSGLSKTEKKLAREKMFHGHWAKIGTRFHAPSGAAGKKRAKRIAKTEAYRQDTGYYRGAPLSMLD